MKTYAVTILANDATRLAVSGTFVRVLRASALFYLRLSESNGGGLTDRLEARAGDLVRPEKPFGAVELVNDTAVAITAAVTIGAGDLESAGLVNLNAASELDSDADVNIANAAHYDVPASDNRQTLIIQAAQGNTGDLLIRDDAGVTSEGVRLHPDGIATIDTSDIVRIRNNSGAAQNVYIVHLRR